MPRKKNSAELPPLFYCDNCGAEVAQNDPACPKCGRKFASVLCPACGFSGEEKLFDDGCPNCGYQVLPGKGGSKNKTVKSAKNKSGAKYGVREDGTLPLWAYAVTGLVFVLALLALLFYMAR